MKSNKPVLVLLIISIIFSITCIATFVYNTILFDFNKSINSNLFDHFGSFYGGVLGTILTAINTYLIYKTFLQANLSREISSIDDQYANVINEINNLEYKNYKGVQALYNFDKTHRINPNSVMNHLCLILVLIENELIYIKKSSLLNDEQKKSYLQRVYLMYFAKLIWPIYEKIIKELFEDKTEVGLFDVKTEPGLKNHYDMNFILAKYSSLTKETYNYLTVNKLIELPVNEEGMMNIINGN